MVLVDLSAAARRLWPYVVGMAIGIAGAITFIVLNLPLPWFLGSLTATMIMAVVGVRFSAPKPLQIPMRAVLGVAVGTAFTPALVARAASMLPSLLLLVPWVLVIMALGTWAFARIAGFDRKTALFASVPGGLTDMVALAEESGANVRAITLIQLTRICLIVFLVPVWLIRHDGFDVAGQASSGRFGILETPPVDLAVLIALGAFGYLAAKHIGFAGPAVVGPMVLSALVHMLGLTEAHVPREVMIIAQVTLGVLLGVQFRGLTLTEFRTTMIWGLAFSAVLLALTLAVTEAVFRAFGFTYPPTLLAYAPGGQAELNLLAYALRLDVAFVALHHLVRLAICILGVQIWLRASDTRS
jgi:membrane AbrB-like protein